MRSKRLNSKDGGVVHLIRNDSVVEVVKDGAAVAKREYATVREAKAVMGRTKSYPVSL